MSEALMINGRKLLPIKEVVGRSRYTRDYIAKLAREGVIVGAQVGRQWFVDEVSLVQFSEASELEAEVRRRHLSAERKRERDLKAEVERQWDVIPRHPRFSRTRAVSATLAVMMIVFLSALAVQQVPSAVTHIATLQKAQVAPGEVQVVAVPDQVITKFADDAFEDSEPALVFADVYAREVLVATSAVLFVPQGTATSTVVIAEIFADPVTVEFSAPGQGMVTGSSSVGTTSIPFVTVPVTMVGDGGSVVMPQTP